VSIRKGKKLVSYDYSLELVWTVEMRDKDGKTIFATAEGKYELPEISNEEDQWELRTSVTKDSESIMKVLDQMVRTLAPKALKDAIRADFVSELEKK